MLGNIDFIIHYINSQILIISNNIPYFQYLQFYQKKTPSLEIKNFILFNIKYCSNKIFFKVEENI